MLLLPARPGCGKKKNILKFEKVEFFKTRGVPHNRYCFLIRFLPVVFFIFLFTFYKFKILLVKRLVWVFQRFCVYDTVAFVLFASGWGCNDSLTFNWSTLWLKGNIVIALFFFFLSFFILFLVFDNHKFKLY